MTENNDFLQRIHKVSELVSAAAHLQLKLGKHSSVDVISIAIQWRYDIDSYAATEIVRHALSLLDAMPRRG